MSINQRITILYESLNLDQKEFCNKIGLNYKTINAMINKDTPPKHDILVTILKYYSSLNVEWLVLGVGEMWKSEIKDNNLKNLTIEMQQVNGIGNKQSVLSHEIEWYERTLRDKQAEIEFLRKLLEKK